MANINKDTEFDIAVIGGGLGGCAAALSASSLGYKVILTETYSRLGGQWTTQLVPPDEHPWIETCGCTARYRSLRNLVRQIAISGPNITASAKEKKPFNPGWCGVSKICCDPRIAQQAIDQLIETAVVQNNLTLMFNVEPVSAETEGDLTRAVTLRNKTTGDCFTIKATYFLDATELGDLLPLTKTEYITGNEGKNITGEPHAPERTDPTNNQAFTFCCALSYDPNGSHIIDKPKDWDFWKEFTPNLKPGWVGKLLSWTFCAPQTLEPRVFTLFPNEPGGVGSLWTYRRLICSDNFAAELNIPEATAVIWPQNDYFLRNLIDVSSDEYHQAVDEAKQLTLSWIYWMQTSASRPDGKIGYPGLYLRPDITGTPDGFAEAPYFRESRRIKSVYTVTEQDIGVSVRKELGYDEPKFYKDSVGVGCYRIDLHPTTAGDNYIDFTAFAFQIPLGSLIPVRMKNLLPACKNIGTTHVTNGCYRLHPTEWNIGESAGLLAGFCIKKGLEPREVHEKSALLDEFQNLLRGEGIELEWDSVRKV